MSIRKRIGNVSQQVGGSQTFNAPGTWTSPARLVSVTVAGRGSAGNPGTNGAAGSAGSGANTGLPATEGQQYPVSVTPSQSYPIVVGPGGFVTISWNPQ